MKTTAYGFSNPTGEDFMTVSYAPQQGDPKIVYFKRSLLSPADLVIYDNFATLLTHVSTEIDGTSQNLDIDFMTTGSIIQEPKNEMVYGTLTPTQKNYIDQFINLVAVTDPASA